MKGGVGLGCLCPCHDPKLPEGTELPLPDRIEHRWPRPSDDRIDYAVQGLIDMIRAVRSMDGPLDTDSTWTPTSQARQRMRTLVEHVLRADARWRWEHPDEPA